MTTEIGSTQVISVDSRTKHSPAGSAMRRVVALTLLVFASLSLASAPTFAPKAVPLLNEQSAGVLGIKNLQLASNGILTSDQKSVKLDSGTQIMIQAQIGGN